MRFLSLAWRNIRRNPRRTALTLIAFTLGVASLVFAWSMFDGSNAQMIGNMTGNYSGHIQIHRQGYTDNPSIDLAFPLQEIAALKLQGMPGIAAVSARTEALALISSADNSRGLLLVGIDPGSEPLVTTLHRKLSAGRYFDKGDRGGILIGKSMAKVLGVDVGSEVAILTQGMQGSIGAQRYRVQGVYDTRNEMIDGMQAFITRSDADELLSTDGQTTSLAIKLTDRKLTDAVVGQMRDRLGDRFEVKGWQQLLPEVQQSVVFHESVGYVITLVLFGIVVIGVANAIMMSIMERLREFGVMMAMGTSATQVFRQIVYEGLLLGLLGFAAGIAIGYALVSYFGVAGITFGKQASQTMQGVSNTIYPVLSWARMLYIATAVLIVIISATLYPAWKAARLAPLEAMRGVRGGGKVPKKGRERSSVNRFRRFSGNRLMLSAMAWRNLTRHPLRTSLTLFAIIFGLGAFVFVGSFANGYFTQMVENVTGMVTGDAQIQHKDFQRDMKPTLSLPDGAQWLDRLRHMPSVGAATARVQTTAMISSPTRSEPLTLIGVSPESEQQVTFLHKSVKEGRYLQSGHDREIIIGRKLAELLQVRLGERVVIMAQDVNGNLASEAFVVAGLFHTGGHGFDKAVGQVTLPAAQNMLGMGNRVTNIVLRAQDKEQLASIVQQAAAMLPAGDIRVLPWDTLVPEVAQMSVIFKRSLMAVLAIVLLMVSVIVMNTVLMSIMERTREFGVMLALGSRPGLIVRLVMLESALVGLLGAICGLGLGGLFTVLHLRGGLKMAAHGVTAVPGVTDVVYPKLSMAVFVVPGTLLPILVLMAALYPAFRASRLEPVKAMRNA